MRRNQMTITKSTVAGHTVERHAYIEQYDGRITVAAEGYAPLVTDLTVEQATAVYDILAKADDDRRQAEYVADECNSDAHRRGLL